MKKSQVYSQIFIYILTIFVISFILVYGYNAIASFKSRAEEICHLKFRNELKSAVDMIMGDFGSVKKKELELCSDFNKVCFIESFDPEGIKNSLPLNINPIIKNNILDDTGKNIFLIGKSVQDIFTVSNIAVDPDVVCINGISGIIKLRLEGKGDHTDLSEWT